jgi:glycine cleavage system transcriptional repressor
MPETSRSFFLSISSRDRIGIVYQVSSAICELGGDIADLRQSVLRGHFTMILLASFPVTVTQREIQRRLDALNVAGVPPLLVSVLPADDVPDSEAEADLENAYVLTASGKDRIGFVATVSAFCARNGINILDLSTAVADGAYTMILLVDLAQCPDDVGALRHKLERFQQETGLQVVLQHYAILAATNEVSIL